MDTIGWVAVVIWAMVGVPYGMKVYNQKLAAGESQRDAILSGVIRGICAPVELAVKSAIGAVKGVIGDSTSTDEQKK